MRARWHGSAAASFTSPCLFGILSEFIHLPVHLLHSARVSLQKRTDYSAQAFNLSSAVSFLQETHFKGEMMTVLHIPFGGTEGPIVIVTQLINVNTQSSIAHLFLKQSD